MQEKLRKQLPSYFKRIAAEFESMSKSDQKLITILAAEMFDDLNKTGFISNDDYQTLIKGGFKKDVTKNLYPEKTF